MDKILRQEMKKSISLLIRNGSLYKRNIFCFGHCNATEEMIGYLDDNGFNVTAILDNNKTKQGMYFKSVKICDPKIIDKYDHTESIVLIAARAYESMAGQLRKMGYRGDIVKVVDFNSFEEYSLSEEVFRIKKERVKRGLITLDAIRSRYVHEHLVICPYNAIGDVYHALSFLPEYCAKNYISETVVAVTGNACRQVGEMFDTKNLWIIDRTQMDELVQAVIFIREKNCIIAHHDRPYTNDAIKYLDKNYLSFTDFYKYSVYGLGKDAVPAVPTKNRPFDNKFNMKKSKALILSPYAKSMVNIPEEYWSRVIKEYTKNGFQVYTNTTADEMPLEGTEPLNIPLNQMVSAAEYAGHFIGIRSGLCDILNTARCRKTVVFPDCYYSTTNVKVHEFFRMPGWEQVVYR